MTGPPAADVPPSGELAARLERLAALIAGAPLNLVSRGDRFRVRETHVEESLRVGEALAPEAGSRWLDLGTGGGLPGLVLAIRFPAVSWVLLDSVRKKVEAVAAFARELELPNVTVVRGRAEEMARGQDQREAYDGVVSRAVASLPTVLELSRGFLREGGVLAAVRGPDADAEIQAARRAMHVLRLRDVHSQRIDQAARPTVLVTMRADGRPPRPYPREVGVPAGAPIGMGRT